jgi:hypothetical protein
LASTSDKKEQRINKDFESAIVWYSLLILIVAILVIVSPIVTIWSLNTLFHTSIEYTIWTYLSALWLTGLIAGSNGIKSR